MVTQVNNLASEPEAHCRHDPTPPWVQAKPWGGSLDSLARDASRESWKVTTTAGTPLPSGLLVTQKLEKGEFLYGKNFIYYL